MMELDRIASPGDMVSGFIAGVLIIGSIVAWGFMDLLFPLAAGACVLGAVVLMDAVFPFGRQPYLASFFGGFLAGCGAVIAASAFSVTLWLLLLVSLLAVLKLGAKIIGKTGGDKKRF